MKKELVELDSLENNVRQAISKKRVGSNPHELDDVKLTFGQKLADLIAKFGGSWTFILTFFLFILGWIGINVWVLASKPFDPYPFILLNLLLSCLAAVQAPIIMMSQNRVEEKDRLRREQDYQTNLKAELEIRLLSDRIDHLMIEQHQRMLDIQELQMKYLEDILKTLRQPTPVHTP